MALWLQSGQRMSASSNSRSVGARPRRRRRSASHCASARRLYLWVALVLSGAAARTVDAACTVATASLLPRPVAVALRAYHADLGAPGRLAVDAAGDVYAIDASHHRILVRTATGRIRAHIEQIGVPISIAVGSSGRLYIGDGDSRSVTAYDAEGHALFALGEGANEFGLPSDIAVDAATGNVYVADSLARAIRVYAPDGSTSGSFGSQGTGDAEFGLPVAIAIDPTTRQLFVADQANAKIAAYDLAGNFLACFGARGNTPGKFNMVQAIAADGAGRLFVADAFEGRVQVVDRSGGFISYIGDFGETAGRFRLPVGLAIDPSHRLFVAAANNGRLDQIGLDSFSDPEAVVPGTARVIPAQIERTSPQPFVRIYVAVPGYRLDQVDVAQLRVNGIPLYSAAIGDDDADGSDELRLEVARAPLLATLPPSGKAVLVISGTIASMSLEATAIAETLVCGPDSVCDLAGADPRCHEATCTAPEGCGVRTKDDGSGCEDGDACTADDTCADGQCAGTVISCDDGNVCTDDSCDPGTGCIYVANTLSCDDGNACTAVDRCADTSCIGTAVDCDDANPCTDDACDPAVGCLHRPNVEPCDDGDACTSMDSCAEGRCVGLTLSCDDANPCTSDWCDPTGICQFSTNQLACDDGNACTVTDTCSDGSCHGAMRDCDDQNSCTVDRCDPVLGCSHESNRDTCDDGDSATVADVCDADGACHGTPAAATYALLRWSRAEDRGRAIAIKPHSRVTGSICGDAIRIGANTAIAGSVIAAGVYDPSVVLRSGVQVQGDLVTRGLAPVGLAGATIEGRVDTSGGAVELDECDAAALAAARTYAKWTQPGLPQATALGAVTIRTRETLRVPVATEPDGGVVVLDLDALRLSSSGTLVIAAADASTKVVVRVHGPLNLGLGARLDVEGASAERVLIVVDGGVTLQKAAHIAGSVLAVGDIRVGREAIVRGALLGASLRLSPSSLVELHPFADWGTMP